MNDMMCPAAAYQVLQKVLYFQYFCIDSNHFPDKTPVFIEVYHEIGLSS